jgi:hypothetical protein
LLLVEPKKSGRTFRDIINGENLHLTSTNTQVYARQPTTFSNAPSKSIFGNVKNTNAGNTPQESVFGKLKNVHTGNPPQESISGNLKTVNAGNPPKESVFGKLKNTNASNPPVFNFKLTELTGEEVVNNQKQKVDGEKKRTAEQQEVLDQARTRAAAAVAAAAAERKKMEALIAKKKMEQARIEEEKRLEAQRIREKERQARELEEEYKRKTREEADAALKAQLLREEREKEIAAMHRKVIKSQVCNRWINELMEDAIMDQVRQSAKKLIKTRNYIKRNTKPIVQRVRQRIEKRNTKALERHHLWNMNMYIINKNPYSSLGSLKRARPLHSTPEGIRERVEQSILAEKYALEDIKNVKRHKINPLLANRINTIDCSFSL